MFRLIGNFFKYIIYFGLIVAGAYYLGMIIWIPCLLGLLYFAYKYIQCRTIEPTIVCPYCGENQLDVSTIHTQTSYSSSTTGNGVLRRGFFNNLHSWNRQTNSLRNYIYTHEARCRKCGHLFNYLTIEEANDLKKRSLKYLIIASVLFVISVPTSFVLNKAEKANRELRNSESYKYFWQIQPNPLKDFDYKLNKNDNTIILRRFEGNTTTKKVHVGSKYDVDGIEYNVIELENGVKLGHTSTESVIIADGIKYIDESLLSGGYNIEAVYLPATLENVDSKFFSYFNKNLTDLYFGGSEEDFARIFGSQAIADYLQSTLIHYNYSVEQLLADAPTD